MAQAEIVFAPQNNAGTALVLDDPNRPPVFVLLDTAGTARDAGGRQGLDARILPVDADVYVYVGPDDDTPSAANAIRVRQDDDYTVSILSKTTRIKIAAA
ncbi:MAG: hypothetical protein KDJ77_17280 [Rhodobiaceae bacterium]|nr:hypothetical protein [Rhodobiaceae bacterium]